GRLGRPVRGAARRSCARPEVPHDCPLVRGLRPPHHVRAGLGTSRVGDHSMDGGVEVTTADGSGTAPRQTTSGPIGRSHSVWQGGLRFMSGTGERVHAIDGNSKTAPSPVETLLNAFGTCTGSDVI